VICIEYETLLISFEELPTVKKQKKKKEEASFSTPKEKGPFKEFHLNVTLLDQQTHIERHWVCEE
jgi:hypothetical protein